MKFNKYLKVRAVPTWKEFYLDYNKLKNCIKGGLDQMPKFVELLKTELEKINSFYCQKEAELNETVGGLKEEAQAKRNSGKRLSKDTFYDLYREMDSLKEFMHLNYHGFRKILKKQQRHVPCDETVGFLEEVQNQPFCKSEALLEYYFDVEDLFSKHFSVDFPAAKAKLLENAHGTSFWRKMKKMLAPKKDPLLVQIWEEESTDMEDEDVRRALAE
eukprot:TRINITY_DN2006_c0_g1_i1.p1 TRINITY_DN2006_c0_g1~~TRINITY_DN2006_c0_g1_i1.p1  ORF type:complete len:216 (+),score=78.14 TRINITY_DN2006_c0_g1_i1:80-727(+)